MSQAMDISATRAVTRRPRWAKYGASGIPDYLARHYWWAYLAPLGVAFFDHPFVINRILWGQYHRIAEATVRLLAQETVGHLLQISCAYGDIIPVVAQGAGADRITLLDVASIQLERARCKLVEVNKTSVQLLRANAENLPVATASVDTVLLFFLLHELPEQARCSALSEALRVLRSGGRLLIADYAQRARSHPFHRRPLWRNLFEYLEPFLGDFWSCDVHRQLEGIAAIAGQSVRLEYRQEFWGGFYRLWSVRLER